MSLVADVELRRAGLHLRVQLTAGEDGAVALLGPNGAGKTTLLRALAGLERLGKGRVDLDGRCLEDPAAGVWTAPERRGVGLVPQDLVLFPSLSALDNVAFGLRARGGSRRQARQRASEWLEAVGAGEVALALPAALSGGQAQRVALARALATAPRLLLLDEPLASVDAAARVELRRSLAAHLAAHRGVRVLVTHDPVEAATLAQRVVILEGGRVVQEGTFADVTARPRSEWAARLAGLNLLRGTAQAGILRLDGGATVSTATPVRGPALATIHPRAVALHRQAPRGSPRNVLRGQVGAIERDGERLRVQVTGPIALVAEVTESAARELGLAAGGAIFAVVKSTEIDVYPV